MKKIKYTLIASLFFFSCKNNHLSINTMKVIVWDMACADELFAQKMMKDSSVLQKKENIKLYEQVFLIHKISKNQFYDNYKYYQLHPDQFKILMDSVQAYGSRLRNSNTKILPMYPSLN